MVTPVMELSRFTAKSEPIPDKADSIRYGMKCPDFTIVTSTITLLKASIEMSNIIFDDIVYLSSKTKNLLTALLINNIIVPDEI